MTASPLHLTAALDDFLVTLRAGKPSPHTVPTYRADLDGVSTRLPEHLGQARTEVPVAARTAANLRAAFADFADGQAKGVPTPAS